MPPVPRALIIRKAKASRTTGEDNSSLDHSAYDLLFCHTGSKTSMLITCDFYGDDINKSQTQQIGKNQVYKLH